MHEGPLKLIFSSKHQIFTYAVEVVKLGGSAANSVQAELCRYNILLLLLFY